MASFVYNAAMTGIQNGTIDLDSDTIRARLVMANTTCDTENDGITYPADFTTLDTCDSTGYADVALTTPTVTTNDGSNRSDFDAASAAVFSGLGGDATRNIVGVLFYKLVTNDSDSPVICYSELTTPATSAATQITIPVDTTNIIQTSSTGAP